MAMKDAFFELGYLVSNFYFVANEVDQKIDYLIHIQATEQHEEILEALGKEIKDLRQSQELLKKDFTETMMKFCATEELEHDYLILRDEVPPKRASKSEEEIILATQEIKSLFEREVTLGKERKELTPRVCKSFPGEKGCVEDNNVTSPNTKNSRTEVKIRTWNWQELEKENQGFRTWSLTKVMTKMYGFTLDKAKKEEQLIENLKKALCLASKKHKNLTKKNFINEVLGRKKSKLQDLLRAVKAIKKTSESDQERCESKELIIEWLYQIEREIFFLVSDLHLLVSIHDDNVAEAKLQSYFRSKLARLKRHRRGRVPVLVYRILALLEGGKVADNGRGIGRFRDESEKLVMSFKIDIVMNRIYKMILCLRSVLIANSTLSSGGTSKKEKLVESAEIVERCDVECRVMRVKIDELLGSTFTSSPDESTKHI
ncbi:hypothetical protein TIFTF001_036007 [Ficus carica]|uniref:Uncharacterized protein n=1 Tax=Ficus carica TaxID=3494 RepID=A0AA88E6U3_FICCA|nr:hypothetical protein TIFTF001_035979 [Ficus carica]GMN66931.1 hypothetical protein TIFTF001_035986 [Ficus carica]GMN66932.1 hypothetical protein TIFTF001_036000 [Ficus carica]GMN66952.1 hypothetical protein TIFTF001_036007 [Ficus carica]